MTAAEHHHDAHDGITRAVRGIMPQIAELVFLEGPQAGESVRLVQGTLRVGRSADCDIRVEDEFASRHHADVIAQDEGFVYVNRSPNGTRVNGRNVSKRLLRDGDVIEIGSAARLRFVVHAQPKAVIGHAPSSEDALGDLLADDTVEQQPPRPRERRSLWMSPKVLVGLGAYFVGLVALAIWLARGGLRGTEPTVAFLTSEQVRNMLTAEDPPSPRALNRLQAREWLDKANRLANTALREPRHLFACYYSYRESLWRSGRRQLDAFDDQERFTQVRDALTREVDTMYFAVVTSYRAGRWREAIDRAQRLLSMMADYGTPNLPSFADHPLHRHVREIIAAARWHIR